MDLGIRKPGFYSLAFCRLVLWPCIGNSISVSSFIIKESCQAYLCNQDFILPVSKFLFGNIKKSYAMKPIGRV